jgi:hypothetical protein
VSELGGAALDAGYTTTSGAAPAGRERLDLEGAKMRYDEAWTEFLLWPDEGGRECVLERLVAYWRLRNRTSIGLEEALARTEATANQMIEEARRRARP